jgi:hypothetical protein
MAKKVVLAMVVSFVVAAVAVSAVYLRVYSNGDRASLVKKQDTLDLASLAVVDSTGAARSVGLPRGGVILLASAPCVHCQAVLSRIGEVAFGRPLPRLIVLAVDGPKPVEDILARLGLRVRVLGLLNRQSVRSVFGLRGVPGLVWVSDSGAVVERVLGEVDAREAAKWCRRAGMLDDQSSEPEVGR